jgi:hypothetical protein
MIPITVRCGDMRHAKDEKHARPCAGHRVARHPVRVVRIGEFELARAAGIICDPSGATFHDAHAGTPFPPSPASARRWRRCSAERGPDATALHDQISSPTRADVLTIDLIRLPPRRELRHPALSSA